MARSAHNPGSILKFTIWSLFGCFIFFIPITLNGTTTISLDHMLTAVQNTWPQFGPAFALAMIAVGGVFPFCAKTWKRDKVTVVLSVLKFLGIGAGVMAFMMRGPEWLLREDILPFLFTKVVIPVAIIVPLGSFFLTFITGYGLLEFIGVLMRPIMRPVWKLPGKAAVDVIASFVGSFAVANLLTNRLYKEGRYTEREAAAILAGFSTVSASFMVIVAKTLEIMDHWNVFFWTALVVTFLVSAITARIYPLNKFPDNYFTGEGSPERNSKKKLFANAVHEGLSAAAQSRPLYKNMWMNLKDGILMDFRLIPTIISVGLLSFILAKQTPVFDYIGYVYYPFTRLFGMPEAFLVAKATAVAGAEMFIPSAMVAGLGGVPLISKFIIGVMSISILLFFSGSIPCILATDVRLSILDLTVIMVERAVLTLIIVAPLAHMIF
jgi:nucleoside recognition membrane protein YjiH